MEILFEISTGKNSLYKIDAKCFYFLPSTVIELDTIIAITQTIPIFIPAIRLVEWFLEPNGFRIPI